MPRRHLRTALAALTLTAAFAAAPPLAAADAGLRAPNLAESVWRWVVALWTGGGETSDIGLYIDPDGSTTPPTGGTSDLGPYIDPNG